MIRRRAKAAGIETEIGCHTFRATGITAYDRRTRVAANDEALRPHNDQITLDEIERIAI